MPQAPTTQVVRIPFLETPEYRSTDSTKDLRFVNGFFEPIKNVVKNKIDYFFYKRFGLSRNIQPAAAAGVGRGVRDWNGDLYSVIGTQIYKNSTNLGVTLTTSTGLCKFAATRPGAATPYLCINDGVKLYCINAAGTVTTVTTNFPSPNTRDLMYFDTYMCVLDTNANLFNCNSDDPTTWVTSNYITSQQYSGTGIGLARQQNMIAVLTNKHFQLFYDAATPSGSPFSDAESYTRQVGCVSNDTIVGIEDNTFWVGNNAEGGTTVWQMAGLSQVQDIGVPPVNRILSQEGTNISSAKAIGFRYAGHQFYILTLAGANRTFVFDPDIPYWYEWTDTTGSNSWPIVAATQHNGGVVVQHATNGWLYNVSSTVYQDDSTSFKVIARTSRLDFDTMARKWVNRLDLLMDVQATTDTVNVSYSDDDYVTISTARTFDPSLARNFSLAWGNFRRRSWQVDYTGNQAFRAVGIELELSV